MKYKKKEHLLYQNVNIGMMIYMSGLLNIKKAGYTMIEVALVISLTAALITVATANIATVQHANYLALSKDKLISDLKEQQIKAMVGDTEGRATHDHYSIRIEQSRYILFHGSSYNANDSSNVIITVDSPIQLTTTFANAQIVFSSVTGEIMSYVNGQNTITVTNTSSGQQNILTLNRYGVVVSTN